jgi:hypothetical protein
MQQRGEFAGRKPRPSADAANGKTLRTGQPDPRRHALRHALELVIDRPHQAHELQDGVSE